MKDKYLKAARNILLGFVLITIGFVLGAESAKRQIASTMPVCSGDSPASCSVGAEVSRKILVYYTHANARCRTCNTIEALAQKTINKRFAAELSKGIVAWDVVNFQKDESFAKRYQILSSTVVLVTMEGDRMIAYELLEGVWEHVNDPVAFEEYVAAAVQEALSEKEEVSE
ncbi:MAG: hypothetical protein KAH23_02150 [Kiritimatiellae bacterium]|nr:hypothetical protein [Kiritimatiellia bacterium]